MAIIKCSFRIVRKTDGKKLNIYKVITGQLVLCESKVSKNTKALVKFKRTAVHSEKILTNVLY